MRCRRRRCLALHALGRQHGFKVTTYMKMGCPLTTAEVPIIAGPFTPYPSCRTWSDNALAQILAERPDYVFFTTTRPILDGDGDYVPDYYLGVWDELSDNGIGMLGATLPSADTHPSADPPPDNNVSARYS